VMMTMMRMVVVVMPVGVMMVVLMVVVMGRMVMVMVMMVMMMTSGDDSHAGYTVVGIHYQHAIHQSPTLSVHSTSNQTRAMPREPPSVLIDGG